MRVYIQNWLKGPYTLVSDVVVRKDEPVPHKWLPGDEITDSTGQVQTRKPLKTIVGIVNFLNRTGYGFTSRGAALYMFHPLNAGYPPFLVASKTKYDANMVAAVSFEHWNDKWPRGGIQQLLGTVGSKGVERNALLDAVNVCPGEDLVYGMQANVGQHVVVDWDYVFNIDPQGCVDVDDVFAWRNVGDVTEFAIAIADVRAWVPEGGELDLRAYERGTTFYDDGVAAVPMLPPMLSADMASLRCDGVGRPVIALVYTLCNGVVTGSEFRQCMMTVSQAYTYETVMGDLPVCERLTYLLGRVLGCDVGSDSHHWVELAMVDYNRQVALQLRKGGVGLLRVHEGTRSAEWNDLAAKTGCADVAFFGYAAGIYVDASMAAGGHSGLGLDCYTHASSPLRRYADLYNQRWLASLCFGAERPIGMRHAVLLNERNALAKALDRDVWFLKNLDTKGITVAEGWALVDKGNGVWSVYVPAWKRRVRGVGAAMAGAAVVVRAYTDLKAVTFGSRVVCAIEMK